jgi:hypothetical protein
VSIDRSETHHDASWFSDVQAHLPTTAPSAGTVEDGQLFLLTPAEE